MCKSKKCLKCKECSKLLTKEEEIKILSREISQLLDTLPSEGGDIMFRKLVHSIDQREIKLVKVYGA